MTKSDNWGNKVFVLVITLMICSFLIRGVLVSYYPYYTIVTIYKLTETPSDGVYAYYHFLVNNKKYKSNKNFNIKGFDLIKGEKYIIKCSLVFPKVNEFLRSKKVLGNKVYEKTDTLIYLCDTTEINDFFQKYYADD